MTDTYELVAWVRGDPGRVIAVSDVHLKRLLQIRNRDIEDRIITHQELVDDSNDGMDWVVAIDDLYRFIKFVACTHPVYAASLRNVHVEEDEES